MKTKSIIAAYLLDGELAQKMNKVPKKLFPKKTAMVDALLALEKTLDADKKLLLDRYYDLMNEYRDEFERHHFVEGFKAGLLFKKEIDKQVK